MQVSTEEHAKRLLSEVQQMNYRRTDRMFAVLMIVQFLAGIAAAFWISPRTWIGAESQVHPHVLAAIILGGIISSFPIILAVVKPGAPVTRYVIAVGQMLMGALFIHLSGGRIETHFHVFGSLAFLAIYRDWRVLVPATIVVAADHILRGVFWPQSVYGVLTGANWRWVEHASWVFFENTFLVISCRRSVQDMWTSARHRAELFTREERYRAVVEQTDEGICLFDPKQDKILETNDAFRRLLGRTAEELESCSSTELLMCDRKTARDLGKTIQEKGSVKIEYRFTRPDNSAIDLGVAFNPISYGGRDVFCVVINDISERKTAQEALQKVNDDLEARVSQRTTALASSNENLLIEITERKKIETELERTRDLALESSRLKSEFLANMSHEIRTPMNGVIGMTGLLLDTELSKDQKDYTETIRTSADLLLTVINDILDFSKIEAGKLHFETVDFDFRQIVEGAVELLAESAHSKGIELASLVYNDLPTGMRGDPGRLRQVLANVIGNAVKFTHRGEVILRVCKDSETDTDVVAKFSISDTGIGIPESAWPQLFQPFTQVDGSTTRRYGGTGLGLAIAKQLVELMGGEIGFESVEGKGSTFWFTARFEKQAVSERNSGPLRASLDSARVLIVDDNATNRKILMHQTSTWGMIPSEVESGPLALRRLRTAAERNEPFDLAILDLMMPDMDGFEAARAIKNDPLIRGTKLVMLTSYGKRGHDDLAQQVGITAYQAKPVRETQLFACLIKVMNEAAPVIDDRVTVNHSAIAADSHHQNPAVTVSVKKILLAEDNVVNQRVALRQLQKLGYSCDVVGNGREAVTAVTEGDYDLVLMDCQMPDMDGYEATAEIRQIQGDKSLIPIIAMTAHALAGEREKCLAAQMDDYITKPVNLEDLNSILRRWLTPDSGEAIEPNATDIPPKGHRYPVDVNADL